MSELQPSPISPSPKDKSLGLLGAVFNRRQFLRQAGAGLLAAFAAPIILPHGRVLASESHDLITSVPIGGGKYFPAGTGLRESLASFVAYHKSTTGENAWVNLNYLLNGFTGRFSYDPATGLCNGFSNYQVTKSRVATAKNGLTAEEIEAVGTIFHYDDAQTREDAGGVMVPLSQKGSALSLHHHIVKYLGGQQVGFVIDRSTNPNEMWSHPVGRVQASVERYSDNIVVVDATLTVGNYTELQTGGYPYRDFRVVYKVQEGNPNYPGDYLAGGNVQMKRVWRPDPPRFWGLYRVDGTVMTPSMIRTYESLAS